MEFEKYQHVEKLGNAEVNGILDGEIFIFPKIDGTNASLWMNGKTELCAGSRNRELTIDNDNAGFLNWAVKQDNIIDLLLSHPNLRLYGEWLVPHSLKTYKEDAWRKFYVFDVMQDETYLTYNEYSALLDKYNIDYIPCIATGIDIKEEQLYQYLDKNNFLIEDGKGNGEGIVIKNYNFVNRFGRIVWAKIVTSEFKTKHIKEMGTPVITPTLDIEEKICDKFVTSALVEKEYSKIVNELNGWESKYIPRLLNTIYYCLITEEMWNILKAFKSLTLNFSNLNRAVSRKIKKIKPEIF